MKMKIATFSKILSLEEAEKEKKKNTSIGKALKEVEAEVSEN
ncbi:MAG: hypothetical protein QXW83_04430 [Nitrososphaerales archaeon]